LTLQDGTDKLFRNVGNERRTDTATSWKIEVFKVGLNKLQQIYKMRGRKM